MYTEEYKDMVIALTAEYYRKYPMTEQSDIQQTLWLWFVSHPQKYKEWSALEQKDRDRLIAKSLRNAAIKYCEREKARKIGYELIDLYYYDMSVVTAFLPSIISESYEIPIAIKDLNYKFSKSETTDTNNWLVLRADIATAFYKLSDSKQNILRMRYSLPEETEWKTTAVELSTTEAGARMKVQRALNSLIRNLGGYKQFKDEDTLIKENDYDISAES